MWSFVCSFLFFAAFELTFFCANFDKTTTNSWTPVVGTFSDRLLRTKCNGYIRWTSCTSTSAVDNYFVWKAKLTPNVKNKRILRSAWYWKSLMLLFTHLQYLTRYFKRKTGELNCKINTNFYNQTNWLIIAKCLIKSCVFLQTEVYQLCAVCKQYTLIKDHSINLRDPATENLRNTAILSKGFHAVLQVCLRLWLQCSNLF